MKTKGDIFKSGLFLLLAMLVGSGPVYAAKVTPPERKPDAFLQQLVSMHELDQSLKEANADVNMFSEDLRKHGLPPEAVWMTKHVLLSAFEPKNFKRTFYEYVLEDYEQEYAIRTIRWLQSPLGKKIMKLQKNSSTQEAMDERSIYVDMLKSLPPQEIRLNYAERLEEAWELKEEVLGRIFPIFRLWFPHRSKYLDLSPRAILNKLEKDIREPMKEGIIRSTLHVYLDLSDVEFGKLVNFAESKTGKWYGRVFKRAYVEAFGEQALRSKIYLENFIARVESDEFGLEMLKETFPPGERYIALKKRDPFMALVHKTAGVNEAALIKKKRDFKKFRDKLKNFPIIPLEVYKMVQKEDPELHANLEYYQELFNDKQELDSMSEEEFLETIDTYREVIERANDFRDEFVKTALHVKYKSLQFVGLIWNGKQKVALIETKGKAGYMVRKGSIVGPNLGVVDSIDDNRIVVVERYRDYLGFTLSEKKKIEFSNFLKSEKGGEQS